MYVVRNTYRSYVGGKVQQIYCISSKKFGRCYDLTDKSFEDVVTRILKTYKYHKMKYETLDSLENIEETVARELYKACEKVHHYNEFGSQTRARESMLDRLLKEYNI